MKKSNCICVTIMMLAAAALVVFGKSVLNTGMGFIIEHRYADALLPKEGGTSFYPETVLWLRVLFVTGILAALLVWVRKTWSTVVTLILCLSSVIIRMYGNAKHGYGLFTFDETAGLLMMLLPFLSAGVCLFMLRQPSESTGAKTGMMNDGRVDLKTALSDDDIRLLASNLKKQSAQGKPELLNLAASIEREGRIPSKALPLCQASTELAMMEGLMTGSAQPGLASLSSNLKKLMEQTGVQQN